MTFSIIIPIYNAERFVSECLDSVKKQSFTDWEVLCIDDGSEDKSRYIVQTYAANDRRIRVFSQHHQGQAVARNVGLDNAAGDYIFLLDADDVIPNNALEVLYNALSRNAFCVDVIKYNAQIWYFRQQKTIPHYYNELTETFFSTGSEYLVHFTHQHGWGPSGCFFCIKRTLLSHTKIRYLPFVYFEDDLFIPLLLSLAQNGVLTVNKNLYLYRMNDMSTTHKSTPKHAYDRFVVAQAMEKELKPYISDTYTYDSIIYNTATLGLAACRQMRLPIRWQHFALAFRHASVKRKIKLLLSLLV